MDNFFCLLLWFYEGARKSSPAFSFVHRDDIILGGSNPWFSTVVHNRLLNRVRNDWLATHLKLADRLKRVLTKPDSVSKPSRAPRVGDLVIAGLALDPRVRIALEVAPSGDTDKITVFDQKSEDRERHFLARHVKYVGWWENGITQPALESD